MSDYRTPPKPHYFDTVPEGTCRWCNTLVGLTPKGKPSKSRWHHHCVAEYKLLHWPVNTRKAVWRRDLGVCGGCGVQCIRKGKGVKWHMDHIKPLIEAKGDLDYWRLPNLQTLCTSCHKVKTSSEATQRAIARKAVLNVKPPEADSLI